jgi:CsoR family transcriptional regulator, copper-sensing transcriptional repressor
MMDNKNKSGREQILISFKKANSSLQTMIKMVEEDRYCVDIMQQNLAVIGLLRSAHEKLMNNHLETCFLEGIKTGSRAKQNQMIEEIENVIRIGNK